MLPHRLLRYEVLGDTVEPSYLDGRHAPIVRALVERYAALEGRTHAELEEAIDAAPELASADRRLVAGLRRVVEESTTLDVVSPRPPSEIRSVAFALAEAMRGDGTEAVLRAAELQLEIPAGSAAAHLYADLLPSRRVRLASALPPVAEIISRYNFRLVQGLVTRADRIRVIAPGGGRAAYRLAKLNGLIVEATREGGDLALQITGPFALFRETRRYGRALASFLPACTLAPTFRVEARLVVGRRRAFLQVTEADRVLSPHGEPRRFDSLAEEHLHHDFLALASQWCIERETEVVPLGRTVFFPDFTFWPREEPGFRVFLEIVGFWTRDYLLRKQAMLRALGPRRGILCVDERLSCDREPSPHTVIRFSRRVPAGGVLEALDRLRVYPNR